MNKLSVQPQTRRHTTAARAAVDAVQNRTGIEADVMPANGEPTVEAFASPVFLFDPFQEIASKGFRQDPASKVLQLGPLWLWPNLVAAPWFDSIDADTPPADSRLICRASYNLGSTSYPQASGPARTGWDGSVDSTSIAFAWIPSSAPIPPNQGFPGTPTDSMPPGGVLIWHFRLGATDKDKVFTADSSAPIHNLLIPPL